ncbi:Hypothetical predicted protein, partial [Olea europaea subsp. europaea]
SREGPSGRQWHTVANSGIQRRRAANSEMEIISRRAGSPRAYATCARPAAIHHGQPRVASQPDDDKKRAQLPVVRSPWAPRRIGL